MRYNIIAFILQLENSRDQHFCLFSGVISTDGDVQVINWSLNMSSFHLLSELDYPNLIYVLLPHTKCENLQDTLINWYDQANNS